MFETRTLKGMYFQLVETRRFQPRVNLMSTCRLTTSPCATPYRTRGLRDEGLTGDGDAHRARVWDVGVRALVGPGGGAVVRVQRERERFVRQLVVQVVDDKAVVVVGIVRVARQLEVLLLFRDVGVQVDI